MPKKRNFLVIIFQKVPKNAFFGLFFQNFAMTKNSWTKKGLFSALGELEKSNGSF